MDDDQQFCLRWNNHQSTLVAVFDTLLENEKLVDCTLAAEGKFLNAHKVVLSACSPYFESLLSRHYDKHPILILKDVKFQELKAMMDYMYRGEVNISQDQLGALLKAAESLQIKGLSDNKKDEPVKRPAPAPAPPKSPQPQTQLPKVQGLTIEQRSRDDREGSMSPGPRKKKRMRRKSEEMDNHHDASNSSDAHSLPSQNIPSATTQLPVNIKMNSDVPDTIDTKQEILTRHKDDTGSQSQVPMIKEKLETHTELMLEPKSEYVEEMNEDSIEDLTLDDDDLSNMEQMDDGAGPSHGGEGSSQQGFGHWQMGNQSQDEVFLAAQEAVGAHRDSQGYARRQQTYARRKYPYQRPGPEIMAPPRPPPPPTYTAPMRRNIELLGTRRTQNTNQNNMALVRRAQMLKVAACTNEQERQHYYVKQQAPRPTEYLEKQQIHRFSENQEKRPIQKTLDYSETQPKSIEYSDKQPIYRPSEPIIRHPEYQEKQVAIEYSGKQQFQNPAQFSGKQQSANPLDHPEKLQIKRVEYQEQQPLQKSYKYSEEQTQDDINKPVAQPKFENPPEHLVRQQIKKPTENYTVRHIKPTNQNITENRSALSDPKPSPQKGTGLLTDSLSCIFSRRNNIQLRKVPQQRVFYEDVPQTDASENPKTKDDELSDTESTYLAPGQKPSVFDVPPNECPEPPRISQPTPDISMEDWFATKQRILGNVNQESAQNVSEPLKVPENKCPKPSHAEVDPHGFDIEPPTHLNKNVSPYIPSHSNEREEYEKYKSDKLKKEFTLALLQKHFARSEKKREEPEINQQHSLKKLEPVNSDGDKEPVLTYVPTQRSDFDEEDQDLEKYHVERETAYEPPTSSHYAQEQIQEYAEATQTHQTDNYYQGYDTYEDQCQDLAPNKENYDTQNYENDRNDDNICPEPPHISAECLNYEEPAKLQEQQPTELSSNYYQEETQYPDYVKYDETNTFKEPPPVRPNNQTMCHKCSFQTTNPKKLRDHLKFVHGEVVVADGSPQMAKSNELFSRREPSCQEELFSRRGDLQHQQADKKRFRRRNTSALVNITASDVIVPPGGEAGDKSEEKITNDPNPPQETNVAAAMQYFETTKDLPKKPRPYRRNPEEMDSEYL